MAELTPRDELRELLLSRLLRHLDAEQAGPVVDDLLRLVYTVELATDDLDVSQFGDVPGIRVHRNRFLDVRFVATGGGEVRVWPGRYITVVEYGRVVAAQQPPAEVNGDAARVLTELGWAAP